MKIHELNTREVQIPKKVYVLNEKVFDLDTCPVWAKWAAVDATGYAYWYWDKPKPSSTYWTTPSHFRGVYDFESNVYPLFDSTDWQHSLIKRPKRKALEVTMADIEKKYGCKVKVVKEA